MSDTLKGLGDVILGRFVIQEVYQRTAIVYHVYDREQRSRQYVLKRVRPEHTRRQEILDWFSREIKIWQSVSGHPHIVRLIEPFRQDVDGASYFFIEFVKGHNLGELIRSTSAGRLSYPQALQWAIQIASAMEYASTQSKNGHGIFVHRDLDSSNILINEGGIAKVSDWGVARNLREPEDQIPVISIHDLEGPAVGKEFFMPPEQFPPRRGRDYGIAGDVYYFGGLIYEMLTGQFPNPKIESKRLRIYAATEEEVRRTLEAHQQTVLFKTLRTHCKCKELIRLVEACLCVDSDERISDFTTLLTHLLELAREVKSSSSETTYQVCRHCSFIALSDQTTCPVCNHTHSFQPWTPDAFEVNIATGEATIPELTLDISPSAVSLPGGSPQNELISIPAGGAILGANDEVLSHLITTCGISGEQLEQLAAPSDYQKTLPQYKIAKFAVSNDEYREFVEATGWRRPVHWQNEGTEEGLVYVSNHPVVNVSFADAEAFCQWKHVRLPNNEEWERAARGVEGRAYTWGNRWEARGEKWTCQTLERHNETEEELVAVDAFSKFASPDGLLNMCGNVWEWVDGGEGGFKHTRGGSWRYRGEKYALTWFRLPTDPDLTQDDVGFRYVEAHNWGDRAVLLVKDLEKVITIPGGSFSLGITPKQLVQIAQTFTLSPRDAQIVGENASRTVRISKFQIRCYLVTNEEYYQFVQQTGYPAPAHWDSQLLEWSDRPFLNKYRFHPVVHVSYRDATAFCSWRGARLPSNEEWEVAARGADGRIYPWGSELDATRCNVSETGLARTNQVDEFRSGVSPFGCHDMVGNVQEWVSKEGDGQYFVRGGAFKYKGGLYGLTFLRIPADPEYADAHIGFRYAI